MTCSDSSMCCVLRAGADGAFLFIYLVKYRSVGCVPSWPASSCSLSSPARVYSRSRGNRRSSATPLHGPCHGHSRVRSASGVPERGKCGKWSVTSLKNYILKTSSNTREERTRKHRGLPDTWDVSPSLADERLNRPPPSWRTRRCPPRAAAAPRRPPPRRRPRWPIHRMISERYEPRMPFSISRMRLPAPEGKRSSPPRPGGGSIARASDAGGPAWTRNVAR